MKIKFRSGKFENLPQLLDGELAYCTDVKKFYVGLDSYNHEIVDLNLLADGLVINQLNNRYVIRLSDETISELYKVGDF